MARPKKHHSEKQTARFPTVRCTAGELATLRSRASQKGISLSEFIRQASLNGSVVVSDPATSEADFQLVHQLQKIGVNLNQLTRIANTTGEIPPALSHVWERIDNLLDELITTI